jgi:hypothetical protein
MALRLPSPTAHSSATSASASATAARQMMAAPSTWKAALAVSRTVPSPATWPTAATAVSIPSKTMAVTGAVPGAVPSGTSMSSPSIVVLSCTTRPSAATAVARAPA